jgi:molybdopterin molybdotransferase
MPEFLELSTPEEAGAKFFQALAPVQPRQEWIDTACGLGRVTAEPVVSSEDLPAFTRATVDGYAVRATDTFGASDSLPGYLTLCGEVAMGDRPGFRVEPSQGAIIHTGGMLPEGADAVIMLEYTQPSRPGEIEIMRAVAAGENVLRAGEDARSGQEIIPVGVRLRPAEIGGAMALGITHLQVYAKPRIGVLSSGDEVIAPDQKPRPGQVRDVNSYSLSAFIEQAGATPVRYGILPDRREALQSGLERALTECDAVVITAGSSASTRDFTADVIQAAGQPGVLVHGVNVRPGKPTILAICGTQAVIGLPGNPVSALVIARLFLVPLVHRLSGEINPISAAPVQARLLLNVASQAGREDWVPVMLREEGPVLVAEPIFYKSNLIFSLVRADGLMRIPAPANGVEANSQVDIWLL